MWLCNQLYMQLGSFASFCFIVFVFTKGLIMFYNYVKWFQSQFYKVRYSWRLLISISVPILFFFSFEIIRIKRNKTYRLIFLPSCPRLTVACYMHFYLSHFFNLTMDPGGHFMIVYGAILHSCKEFHCTSFCGCTVV